jgi:glucose-1-phosphate cytidylyltransferase
MFDYVTAEDHCVLEQTPLEKLAADGELIVRRHDGFWQCMDTLRDVMFLRSLYERGERPWLKAIRAAS